MAKVKIAPQATGSGTTTVQAGTSASDFTLTLPDATDTLVGKATTDTLTNKTLTTPTIDGGASATGTFTPSVSSQGGTITTVGATSGYYTKVGKQVTVCMSIAITDNGTGSTALVVSNLPYTSIALRMCGSGRNESTAVQLLTANDASSVILRVYKYDGTYPVATGQTVVVTHTYLTSA